MMRQSINRKRIYFYLLIFLFISTTFNYTSISKLNDLSLIKEIDIRGLNDKEENNIRDKLKIFKNNNIFFIKKKEIENILSIFNFLDNIYIKKVLPSKLIILAKKTKFLGIAIIDGKKFYIGSNGKFTPITQVTKEENLPIVFGKFPVDEFIKLQSILIKKEIKLKKIKKYFYHPSKRWDLEDYKGLVLMLPYHNVENSLKTYKYLFDNTLISSVKIVDLRIPGNVVLTHE
tara:strand:+ start:6721 stop:7413 length:693 start_codon:yes stop_codon:yes gene_type:complete